MAGSTDKYKDLDELTVLVLNILANQCLILVAMANVAPPDAAKLLTTASENTEKLLQQVSAKYGI